MVIKRFFANKKVLNEDGKNKYKNLSEKEKDKKRKFQRDQWMDINSC